jgi:type I restriction enzyme R subunit
LSAEGGHYALFKYRYTYCFIAAKRVKFDSSIIITSTKVYKNGGKKHLFFLMREIMYNEADTRAKLIDPAIHSRGWTEDLIRREQTAGEIQIVEGRPRRRKGKIDYLLRVKVGFNTQPIAIALIEAKADSYPPNYGLEQAKCYAKCQKFNIPFVFSSNGHLFVEFNKFTGITSNPKRMNEFPRPDDLRARYEKVMGFALSSEQAKPLLIPYTGGEATRRYYQDAAIRAVLEKIAQGGKRALLALATGSGKTFIAVHLLKKLDEAGQLKRALFLCDRDYPAFKVYSALMQPRYF